MRMLKKTALVALTVATLGSVAGIANAGVSSPRGALPMVLTPWEYAIRSPMVLTPWAHAIRSPMAATP